MRHRTRNFSSYLRAVLIVVNTRLLISGRLDGIGRFTYETLIRITQQHPDDQFVFLFDREISPEFVFSENITPVKLFPPARRPWLFNLWFNWSVAGVLRDLEPDLFLSPDGYIPLRGKTKCLNVIHDLNFEHYPEDLPAKYSNWLRKKFPLFAKRATRIATVSEFSKNDIAERYQIDGAKIDVLCNGASVGFKPMSETAIAEVQKKHSQDCPYFLYIGALHPRKNLERLVRAFSKFKKETGSQTKLLIAGGNYWSYRGLRKAVEALENKTEIIFTGRLPEEELYQLMGGALALAYVPYFEGFGIPIVEAMACDVPVITSNITSMPEVAGDAALYADPFSEESIADALKKMDQDPQLRKDLIARARIQREKFTWEKAANALWQSIEKTIQS
jgi:glycosyltransferase involved in cell wall biosynthesis